MGGGRDPIFEFIPVQRLLSEYVTYMVKDECEEGMWHKAEFGIKNTILIWS